jgi:hypothetical protein
VCSTSLTPGTAAHGCKPCPSFVELSLRQPTKLLLLLLLLLLLFPVRQPVMLLGHQLLCVTCGPTHCWCGAGTLIT